MFWKEILLRHDYEFVWLRIYAFEHVLFYRYGCHFSIIPNARK
jgi:hypothetical protein